MDDRSQLTVEMESSLLERLSQLAQDREVSVEDLAHDALAGYVAEVESQAEGVRKAMEELDRQPGIPHEDVKAWVASWGSVDELPMPSR